MRALLIGDVHLADRPPSIRRETYADEVLDKLRHTVRIAQETRVEVVIFAGDMFHLKAPTRTSHALVQKVCDVLRSYDLPVCIVPGNHDMSHDRLESLERQPLGVLEKAGSHMLLGDFAGRGAFGLPWLQDWNDLDTWMEQWRVHGSALSW